MGLLLDTHIFLWMTANDKRLNQQARQIILEARRIFISSATIWELAIKFRIGKLRVDPEDALSEIEICGFQELSVTNRHAAWVAKLPMLHNDPFDRLLIAQAIAEPLNLLTADPQLRAYSELVIAI